MEFALSNMNRQLTCFSDTLCNSEVAEDIMRDHRKVLYYYQSVGAWRQDWFDAWCEEKRPHAQLCTIVWMTGTLAAQEIVKLVSGKWKPVVAPYYWFVTPEETKIKKFGIGRRLISRISGRTKGKSKLLPMIADRPWLVRAFTRLIS
jgi:hypothetical protein